MKDNTAIEKEILDIKTDISSIRGHLKTIKDRQDVDDLSRIEFNRKLDLVVNTFTDNDFNGKNGFVTRFSNVEKSVIIHDMYWKITIALLIPVYAGLIALIFKIFGR